MYLRVGLSTDFRIRPQLFERLTVESFDVITERRRDDIHYTVLVDVYQSWWIHKT